jgi:hypothetical protein
LHQFDTEPKAKDLRYRAKAVLVFIDVVKAAFIASADVYAWMARKA